MDIITILLLLILGAVTIAGYFFKDLPKLIRELKVEKFKSSNLKNLQVEAFYREVKSSEIDDALKYWTSLVMDMDNSLKNVESLNWIKKNKKMQQTVFMYGSGETVGILTVMMQYQYNKKDVEGDNNYQFLIYLAYLACSLKKDFTGHDIDPIDLLRLRITDIDSMEVKRKFDDAKSKVEKSLKNYKTEG